MRIRIRNPPVTCCKCYPVSRVSIQLQEETRGGRRQPEKQGSAIDLDIGPPLEPSQVFQTASTSNRLALWRIMLHCKKKVRDFPVPSRDVTNQTLSGREKLNYSPPWRVWLGTGKSLTFFTVYRAVNGESCD
jgi:hypothetical protein